MWILDAPFYQFFMNTKSCSKRTSKYTLVNVNAWPPQKISEACGHQSTHLDKLWKSSFGAVVTCWRDPWAAPRLNKHCMNSLYHFSFLRKSSLLGSPIRWCATAKSWGSDHRVQAWGLRRLVSVFARAARRPHIPREKWMRKLFIEAGIELPEGPPLRMLQDWFIVQKIQHL